MASKYRVVLFSDEHTPSNVMQIDGQSGSFLWPDCRDSKCDVKCGRSLTVSHKYIYIYNKNWQSSAIKGSLGMLPLLRELAQVDRNELWPVKNLRNEMACLSKASLEHSSSAHT